MDNGASAADIAQPESPVVSTSKLLIPRSPHEFDSPQGGRRDTGGSHQSHSFLTPNPLPVSKSFFTPASNRLSHLPTPQSPNDLNFDLELARDSPLRHGARATSTQTHPSTPRYVHAPFQSSTIFQSERGTPVIDSFLTPESRRPKSSHNTTTPSPPRTPRRGKFQPEAEITPLAISSRTPPVHRREVSPPLRSTLSSPFVDRSEQHTPSHTRSQSHLSSPDSSPMLVDDVLSPGPSAASTSKSTPLKAPVPTRPAGSEMSRIRLQLAAEKAAHPDDTSVLNGKSTANIGVLESPVKGRRIGLFQETSEESFEESLLASGYTPYGDRPAYMEAQTPPTAAIGKARRPCSNRPWSGCSTRHLPRSLLSVAPISRTGRGHRVRRRSRSRLATFNNFHSTLPKGSLVVVEVEGHGRVLMQKHPGERPPSPTESPTLKKRWATAASGGRKKKSARATPNSPAKKVGKLLSVDESLPRSEEISKPNWLDTEFPWSMRAQERRERDQREHEEKMKCIERFLDRASDEESDDEDQSLGLTVHGEDDGPTPLRTGRGKMVPLKANPDAHPRDPQERVMLPSDTADARAALLSKRSIGEDEEVFIQSKPRPSTPGSNDTTRAYHTPTIFDPSDETSYALSTASHLPQHGNGLFSTPKMSSASLWSNGSIGPFQTPSQTRRGSRSSGGALPFAFDDSAGRTTSILAYPYHDTPIRRARPCDAEDFFNSSQSVLESPSASASKGRRLSPRHLVAFCAQGESRQGR
ncbi:hypothetical protein BXZ70DRAFT_1012999 [Cristinia sonorae]|uniref:Uncharacterized protein n=1 Tax=Cristinia sonorae TaxID=1940300 RepID=A0A8K0UFF6_9AGAR|nr:hypothetical protein BXZ70DRAFT_1012999 [Cristinia sonorae]